MYPIRFEPIYKDYVWGGTRIAKAFDRPEAKGKIAESWEISDRTEEQSVVANGPWKGKTLNGLVKEMGEKLLGVGTQYERFPLLLKIIDAEEPLSVQVHPDEMSGMGEPKTEMWVALDSSNVYAGLLPGTTEEKFRKAKNPEKLLEKIDLKRGETVYVPGGRIHSICEGAFLFEVQQNSNTTYRLFDWGRKGRDLHLKEGLACVHWHDKGGAKQAPHHRSSDFHHQLVLLGSCPFFLIERIDVFDKHHIAAIPKTFQILFCLKGSGTLTVEEHAEQLAPGTTYLIPAAAKHIDVQGRCELLRIRLP